MVWRASLGLPVLVRSLREAGWPRGDRGGGHTLGAGKGEGADRHLAPREGEREGLSWAAGGPLRGSQARRRAPVSEEEPVRAHGSP